MARVNKSQYAILGCLTIKPLSAYEMKALMDRSTQFFWSEREGQLYPTLKKLVTNNWVTYTEEAAQKVGLKKIYVITAEGKQAFDQWFVSEMAPPVERNELLLRLFFAKSQHEGAAKLLLEQARQRYQNELDKLNAMHHYLKQQQAKGIDITYYEMTLEHGLTIAQAEINWCQAMLKKH